MLHTTHIHHSSVRHNEKEWGRRLNWDNRPIISLLSLQESYSLSIIMYAAPALAFTSKQIQEFHACWNSVIRRLFGYSKHESAKAVLLGLGILHVRHLIMQRKVKFYKSLYLSNNSFCMRLMLYSDSTQFYRQYLIRLVMQCRLDPCFVRIVIVKLMDLFFFYLF